MLGKANPQIGLFGPDNVYREYVGANSFYAFLAEARIRLFRDEDFRDLYRKEGRPCVPPSLLCVGLILQAREGVSDHEAIERTAYDLRWKVALGLEVHGKLCAKSTLQEFRAKLLLNDRYQALFERSIDECRRSGLLSRKKLEVAIDTTPIFGKGAVKDTFNLVADQIRRVVDEGVKLKGWKRDEVISKQGLSRYFGKSFKGEAEIDWSNKEEKRALIGQLVADAKITLELAKKALRGYHKNSEKTQTLRDAQALLSDLLLQDIEEEPEDGGGPEIRKGTSRDRVASATDSEVRHGRKSNSNTFTGHKASIVAETTNGVILGTDIIAGNSHDSEGAAELLRASSERADGSIERVLGDTAYGSAAIRQELEGVADEVVAKAPPAVNRGARFTVDDFKLDEANDEVTCPSGKRSAMVRATRRGADSGRHYTFSPSDCQPCPLREQCTAARARSVVFTEVTKHNKAHRRMQRQPGFLKTYRRRVIVEHRIARLVQLGIRKARFFGRLKVAFQVAMAATVANLSLAMG